MDANQHKSRSTNWLVKKQDLVRRFVGIMIVASIVNFFIFTSYYNQNSGDGQNDHVDLTNATSYYNQNSGDGQNDHVDLTNATNDMKLAHLLRATSNKDILQSKQDITDILHEVRANLSSYTDMIEHSRNIIATHCPLSLLEDYAVLNQQMDKRKIPHTQRLSVFHSRCNGLGDRLTFAATTFYTAMLSNRAFKMVWFFNVGLERKIGYESPVSIFDGYESPWINLPLNGNNTFTEQDNQQSSVQVHFNWFDGHASIYDYYSHANISSTYHDKRMVHWNGNHGNIHLLMQNPNHEEWFRQNHLDRENVFGCAMQYLFQLTPVTFVMGDMTQLFTLFRRPEILKIGMHIRMGDKIQSSIDHASSELMDRFLAPFISCAQQIEIFHQRMNEKSLPLVLWYVTSDSEAVISRMHNTYPERTVSLDVPENSHISNTVTSNKTGIQSAIQQHYLLGMQDYAILYDATSFGRTGALRQLRSGGKHMYDIVRGVYPGEMPKETSERPKCGPQDYVKWEDYRDNWLGI